VVLFSTLHHQALPASPPRRTSDLQGGRAPQGHTRSTHCSGFVGARSTRISQCRCGPVERPVLPTSPIRSPRATRCPTATSTLLRSEEPRLNSSHVKISYAVFCLKK